MVVLGKRKSVKELKPRKYKLAKSKGNGFGKNVRFYYGRIRPRLISAYDTTRAQTGQNHNLNPMGLSHHLIWMNGLKQ